MSNVKNIGDTVPNTDSGQVPEQPVQQKMIRVVDPELRLLPYYDNFDVTLEWYSDPVLCKQVDNSDEIYTPELLKNMYSFLDTHGSCYYIEYRGKLAGDITLRDNNELCIVISREYQNRHIGRRCVAELIKLAGEKGIKKLRANIYAFNTQSQAMFTACGFIKTDDEWFEYLL